MTQRHLPVTGACLFALFHIVTIVWTLFASSGSGEGQAFLVMLLDFPLVALLQAIPGGSKILYDSTSAYSWRIGAVGDDVRSTVGSRLGPAPTVVVGDFDGNSRQDVALLIEYRNVDEPDKAFTHYIEIIAFLDRGHAYESIRLEDRTPGPDPGRYLTLQERGEQGFDFEGNKRFRYPHDSIGVWFFEKAGGTYIYDKGKFRFVLEAD